VNGVTLIVIAKEPVPGRAKTRLCPPCTPAQSAQLAEASLADTLATVAATPAPRRVCVLEGAPGAWLPAGVEVLPQRGGPLDERLAAAFDDVGGPALLVGMDTPQLSPRLLAEAAARLMRPGTGAVLGLADDGGWWAIGLRRPDPALFIGVPMSEDTTGLVQLARLEGAGLETDLLPQLRDMDTIDDARAAARGCEPHAAFPLALRAVETALAQAIV
jgi:uncharacterized protein